MVTYSNIPSKIATLIFGDFKPVKNQIEAEVPDSPGIYCIKLAHDVELPAKFGIVREDRIIYIGMASVSLRERLWREELRDVNPATFFRSIGTILEYLPSKGSKIGTKTAEL